MSTKADVIYAIENDRPSITIRLSAQGEDGGMNQAAPVATRMRSMARFACWYSRSF